MLQTKKTRDRHNQENGQQGPTENNIPSVSTRTKFVFSLEQLRSLHDSKNLEAFREFGGLRGLESGLRTNRLSGLSDDGEHIDVAASLKSTYVPSPTVTAKEGPGLTAQKTARSGQPPAEGLFVERKRAFLDNHLPTKKQPSFPRLVWMTYNDPVLFLLTAAAAISLAIGVSQTFTVAHTPDNPGLEWVEGVAILVAIFIIVIVGSVNDWEKQRQFRKLNRKQLEREVKVIRSGSSKLISISDVLVGDVVHLELGDVIPADGILISGYNITCDESTATGESEVVHKSLGDEAFEQLVDSMANPTPVTPAPDPFILSGTKVREGIGTFLVTATGINSTYGKILTSLKDEPEPTPLQIRLNVLAKYIAIVGGVSALLLFVALFIKFLASLPHSSQTPAVKAQTFVNILILALTVLVIAVPEGLPLAVTLSLAFASTKMLKDHNLVRHLKACETMGNVTSICSDKTGTLTQNKMVVVAGAVSPDLKFHNEQSIMTSTLESAGEDTEAKHLSPDHFFGMLDSAVKSVLVQSIALNSTAFEGKNRESFVGSDTESALLTFASEYLGMGRVEIERSNQVITQQIPFSAARQCMATVVQLPSSECGYRVYIKGASEVLLDKCSWIIQDPTRGSSDVEMSTRDRQSLARIIDEYASQSLRTISLAYRDFHFPSPLIGNTVQDRSNFTLDYLMQGLIFLSVIGIRDPLRIGVPEAVRACQRAGVTVRMVTGDNLRTAKAIADQCGILSENESDMIMEGAQFRALSPPEIEQVIPRLKVLARSSPEDKQNLVIRLRKMGETVAVTGDGTNDAPALSTADVSFSMGGLSGTEIAREASSIVLMNDDFSSIVKAILWGRAVNDSVKTFLQFQITITVTSVALTFVSSIANATGNSVLTAVQLMWVNLFQDTLAALALATAPPQPRVLHRTPESRLAPLINIPMWKTIIGQSIYQVAVTLVLYFAGARILSYDNSHEHQQLQTLIFNTYVWLQIFNMYNCQQYDNTLNVFEGTLHNWLLLTISTVMIGVQILIIFVGGHAFTVVPLTGPQWAISLVLGFVSLPIGALIRIIPDGPFERLIDNMKKICERLTRRRSRSEDGA